MRRLAALLALAVAGLLGACGSDDPAIEPEDTTSTSSATDMGGMDH